MHKLLLIGLSLLLLSSCSLQNQQADPKTAQKPSRKAVENTPKEKAKPAQNPPADKNAVQDTTLPKHNQNDASTKKGDEIQVVAQPESIPVLVNKQNKLPESYMPHDLVTTTVPFISTATSEKRKMRKVAADALAEMFAAAEQEGVKLLGVSGYRSHATQTSLFNYYVRVDGLQKARTYSAIPGTSEHETGLAIDVTGGDGKCAADDCFGGTVEAEWLAQHAAEYGFIIRYPKGKEAITGYKYEPWHIRYVGKEIAQEIMNSRITLEEFTHSQPVNN